MLKTKIVYFPLCGNEKVLDKNSLLKVYITFVTNKMTSY